MKIPFLIITATTVLADEPFRISNIRDSDFSTGCECLDDISSQIADLVEQFNNPHRSVWGVWRKDRYSNAKLFEFLYDYELPANVREQVRDIDVCGDNPEAIMLLRAAKDMLLWRAENVRPLPMQDIEAVDYGCFKEMDGALRELDEVFDAEDIEEDVAEQADVPDALGGGARTAPWATVVMVVVPAVFSLL